VVAQQGCLLVAQAGGDLLAFLCGQDKPSKVTA
jgi:hypothetical protein